MKWWVHLNFCLAGPSPFFFLLPGWPPFIGMWREFSEMSKTPAQTNMRMDTFFRRPCAYPSRRKLVTAFTAVTAVCIVIVTRTLSLSLARNIPPFVWVCFCIREGADIFILQVQHDLNALMMCVFTNRRPKQSCLCSVDDLKYIEAVWMFSDQMLCFAAEWH